MAKNYWFKFEWLPWLNDRDLRRCTFETHGFWINCIALMEESETWFLEGTISQLANLLGCSPAVAKRCIDDLEANHAAQIERRKLQKSAKSQEIVKITSRRILRRYNLREYNRLAKQKERKNRNVKPKSKESSKELEFKSLRESPNGDSKTSLSAHASDDSPPPEDPRRSHPAIVAIVEVTGLAPPKEIWDEIADRLGYDVDHVKLKQAFVKWRANGYKITNYNGIIDWYLNGVPKAGQKAHGTARANNTGSGRTTAAERIADHADIISQYPTEAELRHIP